MGRRHLWVLTSVFACLAFAGSDPPTAHSFGYGGSGIDIINAMAVDRDGHIYLAGYTNSKDLPATDDAFQKQPKGYDAFVAKLTAAGDPIWTTYLGGNDARASSKSGPGDAATAIDVDLAGNVYVAGYTASTDFPVVNAWQSQAQAPARLPSIATDGFVAKLSPDGDRLQYSTYLGAPDGSSRVDGMRAGPSGEVWLLVSTSASSFETTRDLSDDGQIVVMKLDDAGSRMWASRIGARGDSAAALVVDGAGQPAIAGRRTSTVCDEQSASLWCAPAFVTRLNAVGSRVRFSTTIGGTRSVWTNGTAFTSATDLALMPDGRTAVVGTTSAADLPVTNAWQSAPGGDGDAFVGVLTSTGEIEALTYFGGNGTDGGTSLPRIAVDRSGMLHLATDTYSTDMPVRRALSDRHPDGPFFRSFDDAESWQWSSVGAAGSVKAFAIDPGGERLYAATSAGVLRSADSGASWTPANEGLLVPDGSTNQRVGSVETIAIDPRQPNVIYAGVRGSLFRSDDGANTWTLVRSAGSGVGGFFPRFVAVSPHDGSVWVAAGNGVDVSADGGATWERRNRGLPSTIVGTVQTPETLVFDPRRSSVVYAGLSQGLFASEDNGASWENLTRDVVDYPGGLASQQFVTSIALDPFDGSVIYAGTFNRGVLKSTDDGHGWSRVLQFTAVRSLTIDPHSPETVYVSSRGSSEVPGKILRSRDGGRTWTSVDTGLTMRSAPAQILTHPFDRNRLYTAAENLSFVPFVARLESTGASPTLASYLTGGSVRDVAVTPEGDTLLALMGSSSPSKIVIVRVER